VGAILIADIAHIAGLIAVGVHPSCLPHASLVTSTTHKTLRGPRGAFILSTQELSKKVDRAVFPYTQGGPLMHVIAAKAVCFGEALKPEFKAYGQQIVENARALAAELETGGLRIVSGGTDNHLLLVDLRPLKLTGQEAEDILGRVNITVNKNAIPYDPQPPRVASGLRLGTPAVTSRGFGPQEMRQVARLIIRALAGRGDIAAETQVKEEVEALTARFPTPGVDELLVAR
jgi:glycine hydroxymethyltransferase